jgi:osmotically-inducible protein OsmY
MATPQAGILKELGAILERDPRINLHRYPIHSRLSGDDLVLEGETKDIRVKKLALELAAAIPGVGRIVDRLRVAPAERMGDPEIRDRVCEVLLQDPALIGCSVRALVKGATQTLREAGLEPGGEIVVEVKEGVVILNGRVPSLSHKRVAGVLAWWVPGSRDVVNGLEEAPPETDNDDEVTDAVRLVLERDPFVNPDGIRVQVQNYVVTLQGVVSTPAMKDMAELDAWYVFGVDRVVNSLEVQR